MTRSSTPLQAWFSITKAGLLPWVIRVGLTAPLSLPIFC